MREVMKNPPSPIFVDYILSPNLKKDAANSFDFFNSINKAHLMMLVDQGIVKKDVAKEIYKSTRKLEAKGVGSLNLDAGKEDLSSCIEAFIIADCGAEIGGQLHTGRSRNDLGGTVARMNFRRAALEMGRQINELRECMLNFAKKYTDCVCTGYTCGQPAEPVTIAYQFCAYLTAMERDYARLADGWKRLNQCPLGSCAMAGTTFPINREQVAELLAFDKPGGNCLDSIAARDYILELFADLSIFGINLSRFCQDMYTWSTFEFNYLDIDSSVCMCSSIMPQKKNPVTLEHVKAKAGHLQAAYISASTALKSTPYTQVRDSSIESAHALKDAAYEMESCVQLLKATIDTMKFNTEHMLAVTSDNFSTVSELANAMVRHSGLSFRQAHSVVGRIVRHLLDNNETPSKITPEMVHSCAEEVLGKGLDMTPEQIYAALQPIPNAMARVHTGAPGKAAVEKQLELLEKQLEEDKALNAAREEAIAGARENLEKMIDRLIAQ
ncbi:MAG: argininosuccinate lyase [Eubacteriales bacterium]|nr:argininosuccinate lyase [Eubacteriales bacterium]